MKPIRSSLNYHDNTDLKKINSEEESNFSF